MKIIKIIAVGAFILISFYLWQSMIQDAKRFTSQWKSTKQVIIDNNWNYQEEE